MVFTQAHGAGLLYGIVVDLCDDKLIWTAGPKPASTHDVKKIRDGKEESKSKQKKTRLNGTRKLYILRYLRGRN